MIHAIELEEASSKAVKISEWIEDIILLDDLLALHAQHGAEGIEANQYREKRQGMMEQLMKALLALPLADKIRVADTLRAAAAAEEWRLLAPQLPDEPSMSLDEIVAEVKSFRKEKHLNS